MNQPEELPNSIELEYLLMTWATDQLMPTTDIMLLLDKLLTVCRVTLAEFGITRVWPERQFPS